MAGSPRAELWVSADTPDADWVVKITIVAPDGTARAVSEGILRSSFRESETNPSPIEPGKIYRVQIDLGHTAFALAPGHALRVEIAASCFPCTIETQTPEKGHSQRQNARHGRACTIACKPPPGSSCRCSPSR